jgi:hypothetical protein
MDGWMVSQSVCRLVFFIISWGGVEVCSLLLRPRNGLFIVPAPDDDDDDDDERGAISGMIGSDKTCSIAFLSPTNPT